MRVRLDPTDPADLAQLDRGQAAICEVLRAGGLDSDDRTVRLTAQLVVALALRVYARQGMAGLLALSQYSEGLA